LAFFLDFFFISSRSRAYPCLFFPSQNFFFVLCLPLPGSLISRFSSRFITFWVAVLAPRCEKLSSVSILLRFAYVACDQWKILVPSRFPGPTISQSVLPLLFRKARTCGRSGPFLSYVGGQTSGASLPSLLHSPLRGFPRVPHC